MPLPISPMLNPRQISSQLRAAAELWDLIKNSAQPADRFLGNYFHRYRKKFGSRDRRFLSEIIYSLFRNKLFLETWAAACKETSSQSLVFLAASLEGLITPSDVGAPFMAPGASDVMNHAPTTTNLSIRYSCPEWLLQKWTRQFGEEETRELLEAIQKRPPFVIRTNTLKISRDKLIERLQKKGFQVSMTGHSATGILFQERANLFGSEEFREGLFEVQDDGSQQVCERMDAKPGEVVWDVCAGAGGKSLALAAAMQNKGRIIATDIRQKKLEDLRKRAKRAGVTNIFPADLERMGEIKAIRSGIDKIVVDAPCSGTGTLRRNPDAKWRLKENIFAAYQRDQVQIVEKTLPYLKIGGRLFYITCSLEPEENEQVMREILQTHPGLRIVASPRSKDGFFRVVPHKHNTDGFFLAVAEKSK